MKVDDCRYCYRHRRLRPASRPPWPGPATASFCSARPHRHHRVFQRHRLHRHRPTTGLSSTTRTTGSARTTGFSGTTRSARTAGFSGTTDTTGAARTAGFSDAAYTTCAAGTAGFSGTTSTAGAPRGSAIFVSRCLIPVRRVAAMLRIVLPVPVRAVDVVLLVVVVYVLVVDVNVHVPVVPTAVVAPTSAPGRAEGYSRSESQRRTGDISRISDRRIRIGRSTVNGRGVIRRHINRLGSAGWITMAC